MRHQNCETRAGKNPRREAREVWAKRKGVEAWPWTVRKMGQGRLSGRGEGWSRPSGRPVPEVF